MSAGGEWAGGIKYNDKLHDATEQVNVQAAIKHAIWRARAQRAEIECTRHGQNDGYRPQVVPVYDECQHQETRRYNT